MKYRDELIEGLSYSFAIDCVGFYPKSIVGGSKAYEQRSERQEGWNDALGAVSEKSCLVSEVLSSMTSEQFENFMELYSRGSIFTFHTKNGIEFGLNMNDTFGYACADTEIFTFDDLGELRRLFNKYSHDGLTAWASMKRNWELPIKPRQTKEFEEAIKELKGE